MKLLLCKSIDKLGIVGDIIEVSAGYGRNYLLPGGLATEPTDANVRALAEDRKVAELDRKRQRTELEMLAERLKEVEVTIRARANETGVLYGSVGQREIVAALGEEGYFLQPDQVVLAHPLRQLDSTDVEVRLAEGIRSSIKVWIVREKAEGSDEDEEQEAVEEAPAGREAGSDDHVTGE